MEEKEITVRAFKNGGAHAYVPKKWLGHMVQIHRYEREVKKCGCGAHVTLPQALDGMKLKAKVITQLEDKPLVCPVVQ